MRFHVLGIGSIGTLVSHHLRHATPSPISLIYPRARHIRPKDTNAPTSLPPISLSVQRGTSKSRSTGFDIEKFHDAFDHRPIATPGSDARNGRIDSLIVSLKTVDTLPALKILSPRIHPESVITLLQNGMGVYDQLCLSIFPDPSTRPHFILGTTTHGVTRVGTHGSIKHMSKPGEGVMKFGVVPDPRNEVNISEWLWPNQDVSAQHIITPPSSPSIPLPSAPGASCTNLRTTLNTLLSMSELSPTLLPMPHLHHQLLLKLAINSAINPLTAILGLGALPNGALTTQTPGFRLIRQVLSETSEIITAYLRSLSEPLPPAIDVLRMFSPEALEQATLAVVRATADNTSSMAADIGRGKLTEIGAINGYLVGLGARLGVPTPIHGMLVQMTKYVSAMSHPESEAFESHRKGIRGMKQLVASAGKVVKEAAIPKGEEHSKAVIPAEDDPEARRQALATKNAEARETIREKRRSRRGNGIDRMERYIKWRDRKRSPTEE